MGLFPQESDRSRKIPRASGRQNADGLIAAMNKPIKEGWTTGDISGYGFALTLVLSGTILSAYSDRPVFWLLVGPGPLVMGLTFDRFSAIQKIRHLRKLPNPRGLRGVASGSTIGPKNCKYALAFA